MKKLGWILLAGTACIGAAIAAPSPKAGIATMAELPVVTRTPYDETADADKDVAAAFARAREVSCRSNADPLPRYEPLFPTNDAARSPCDQRMLLNLMRLGAARYLGRLDS